MKIRIIVLAASAFFAVAALSSHAPAQLALSEPPVVVPEPPRIDPVPLPPPSPMTEDTEAHPEPEPPAATDALGQFLAGLVVKYPIIATIVAVLGLLRALVKPVFAFFESRAAATPDTADDERLERTKKSWWFRALTFGLDWAASVKIGRS